MSEGNLEIIRFLINNYDFDNILDLGCGEAEYATEFSSNGIKYTGVDITLRRTSKELKNHNNIKFIEQDLLKYESKEKFDCVFSSHTIEHMPDTERFLRSFFFHIKVGGIFCIIWPPPKPEIVSGHVHVFNIGLMLYNLVRLGINCRKVKMLEHGYNLATMGKYEKFQLPDLTHNEGDIERLSNYFPFKAYQGFNGDKIPGIMRLSSGERVSSWRQTPPLQKILRKCKQNMFIHNLAHKLKFKKLIKKIFYLLYSISNVFKKDYSGKGERQASVSLDGIRQDHVGRYKFACKFINKNDIVLDCACGVGYGSFIMSTEADLSNIIAVDKEKQAIKFARRNYYDDKITYREGDIFSLDIPDNHFDSIVSFETVEHVDGPALLQLFHKKLKVGGLLIISSPNQNTMLFNKKQFPFHLRHYTPLEFSTLLTSQGFEIIKKATQYDIRKEEVLDDWDGLFNIAVARKAKAKCV